MGFVHAAAHRELGPRRNVQLIGDAAHAMLPNIGQGAGQAFEDAYILARWLQAESDPAAACENFRRVRIPRVHTVQLCSAAIVRAKHDYDRKSEKAAPATVDAIELDGVDLGLRCDCAVEQATDGAGLRLIDEVSVVQKRVRPAPGGAPAATNPVWGRGGVGT